MEPSRSSHSSLKRSLISQPFAIGKRRRYRLFNSTINELESSAGHDSYRFIAMAVLTSTMMVAEIVTGIITGSLTLLSDSLHMLSDLIALIIGFVAHKKANTSNKNEFEHTMVYMRYEIVGALINGTVLLTSCLIMGIEAIQRIGFQHEEIDNVDLVLIVGGLGLFINIIGLFIFGHDHGGHSHGHSHGHNHGHTDVQKDNNTDTKQLNIQCDVDHDDHDHDIDNSRSHSHIHAHGHSDGNHGKEKNLNIHGVFLHILSDLLGSVAVMISALIIRFTDGWWNLYIDPVCTLFMTILISRTAFPLVKQSVNILLDKSPFNEHIINNIEKELRAICGVLNVHELHCWEVKTGYYMATVHLIIDPELIDTNINNINTNQKIIINDCKNKCDILQHDKMNIIDQSKKILHKYGIHSSIVQSEYPRKGNQEWEKGDDPCFDYVCDTKDCIKKGISLSNSMANIRKRKQEQSNTNSNDSNHDDNDNNTNDDIVLKDEDEKKDDP